MDGSGGERVRQSLYDYCIENRRKDLLKQWDKNANLPLSPKTVTKGSSRRIYWICKNGHSFVAAPCDRIVRNTGCPVCAGKKIVSGINDLATLFPELLPEWNETKNEGLQPETISPYTHRKAWWTCAKCGHEWQTQVNSRVGPSADGCPVCAGKVAAPGVNDLASCRPEIAKRWHPTKNGSLTPDMVTGGSTKKVWWQCEKGHEYEATIGSQSKNGCPVCSGKKVLAGFNDLASLNPKLAKEWNNERNGDLKPDAVTVSCNKKVWWKCEKGHEWQTTISSRSGGTGCPYCANYFLLKGFNDLASQCPELAREWNYARNGELKPDMVIRGTSKKVWWICDRGHEWQATISSRSGPQKCGCRECYNDFARTGRSRRKKIERW